MDVVIYGSLHFCTVYGSNEAPMETITPLIIPRSAHPISRGMVSPNALRVLSRLRDQGFIAYLVGGCVRDLLLGREPKDFDVVTDATPGQLKRLFRNCRLVGRRFRLAHIHFQDELIEVATFRALQAGEDVTETGGEETTPPPSDAEPSSRSPRHLKSDEGMVLRDNVFGNPREDALRRDFTVNALFYNIADFSLIDYAGGMADLEAGVIRTIGDPLVRFTEDPVRMLRAVRFAAMLGLNVEQETWQAVLELAPTINRAAPPRLFEEMLKLFLLGEGEKSYQLLRQTGLFAPLFPRFSAWLDTETDGFPHTRVSQALDRVDALVQRGETVAPPLFLALVFGEYLEESAAAFRQGGASPQEALNQAVAGWLGELAPTVLVPNRIGMQVRDILSSQQRFGKMPGKRPQSFLGRPGFSAALAYLRLQAEMGNGGEDIWKWWDRYSRENVVDRPSIDTATPEGAPPTGKRRRRRRRKPRTGAPAPR